MMTRIRIGIATEPLFPSKELEALMYEVDGVPYQEVLIRLLILPERASFSVTCALHKNFIERHPENHQTANQYFARIKRLHRILAYMN